MVVKFSPLLPVHLKQSFVIKNSEIAKFKGQFIQCRVHNKWRLLNSCIAMQEQADKNFQVDEILVLGTTRPGWLLIFRSELK